jgi:phospholipase/carboxylesterase
MPREPSVEDPPLLVLLHGRGAEAKTIFSIQGLLDQRFQVIAFTAPYPSSIGGFEWFHPKANAGDEEIDDADRFGESEKILTQNIQRHIERLRSAKSPLFLWGFSQGAAMSLILGLRGEISVTGIVPMSGFLPSPIRRWKHWNTNVRVILSHGSNDEVLSPETSRHTQTFLESIGIPSEYYEYKGPHKMSLNAIAHINDWILNLAGMEAA